MCHLLCRVKIPRLVYYGESLLLSGVDHENLEDSPGLQRENLGKNSSKGYSTSQDDKFE